MAACEGPELNLAVRPGGPDELRGLVDPGEMPGVGHRDHLQSPGAGRQLRHDKAHDQQQDGRLDVVGVV
ncbi:hypothetical protein ACFYXH_36730 [Streptomyces sp. NPDC002730]|uniref:hypothetical protein n=1 Tax=Streptomyces sp. NPDC002730 TaxID=3364662 RepID=UPI0036D0A014